MEIQVFTMDSFTNLPFKGNPAAVCPLAHELNDDLYQKIAAEMNLSETAFVTPINPSDTFTSGKFICSKCSHARHSLSSVLSPSENINPTLVFETRSGDLAVSKKKDGYLMDFPLNPPTQDPKEFKDFIRVTVGNLPVQGVFLNTNMRKLMIRLSDSCDRAMLTGLNVDPTTLLAIENEGKVKGIIVTVKGSADHQPGYDFYSRNFSPWFGIPEDPVTGSTHTILGSYWSKELGKTKMLAYQCSSRGGELELEVRDDGRINIGGEVVTVLQGIIRL
uniref:Phenazine biosynthesis like protein domain containing n=1 Tax=Nothobranchius furzeri TaxID=105023 RepID=A0A8C6KNT5_NOTFU